MGRHKHSIDAKTLESIEQSICSLPNGAVVKKLPLLSSFSWPKTADIVKAYRINPRTLFRWISQYKEFGVEGLVDNPKGHRCQRNFNMHQFWHFKVHHFPSQLKFSDGALERSGKAPSENFSLAFRVSSLSFRR